MNPLQRKQIIDSQRDAWKRHGYHPNALFWSNEEVQQKRFEVFLDIGSDGFQDAASVLDIGSGFGDLEVFLQNHEKSCACDFTYTGIDLSAELLEEGRKRYTDINLYEGDLFDFDPPKDSYDYVFLSGTLNRQLNDEGEYAYKVLQRMLETCRVGVAFNLLDHRNEWTASRWDLQSFDPQDILKFVDLFASKTKLVDDYLENDFTILAWK